jgi:hypothetical protein
MRYNSNILNFDGSNKIIHARIENKFIANILTMENWVGTNDNAKSTCIRRIILIDQLL